MICLNCGKLLTGRIRKYCNIVCSRRYNNRKYKGHDVSIYEAAPPIRNNKPTFLKCLSCHKEFRRTKNGGPSGNEYTRYCSSHCGTKHTWFLHKEIASIRKLGKSKPYRRKKSLERITAKAYTIAKREHCRRCGAGIKQDTKQFCKRHCDRCNKAARSARNAKLRRLGLIPKGNDRRRARHFGVEYEPIKRKLVFDAHNWICAYCGIETPERIKGMNKPNSPELDHIMPISKGGPHTYSNVQLLCRACNAIKSDKQLSQASTKG